MGSALTLTVMSDKNVVIETVPKVKKPLVSAMINHIDVTVTDLSQSISFYDNVLGELGFTRSEQYAGNVPCWVSVNKSGGEFSIGLHNARRSQAHDRYSAGLHHIAFHAESREAVDAFYDFLRTAKITVLDTPAEYNYTPGYYAVFFADPDGIKWELVYEPRLWKKI